MCPVFAQQFEFGPQRGEFRQQRRIHDERRQVNEQFLHRRLEGLLRGFGEGHDLLVIFRQDGTQFRAFAGDQRHVCIPDDFDRVDVLLEQGRAVLLRAAEFNNPKFRQHQHCHNDDAKSPKQFWSNPQSHAGLLFRSAQRSSVLPSVALDCRRRSSARGSGKRGVAAGKRLQRYTGLSRGMYARAAREKSASPATCRTRTLAIGCAEPRIERPGGMRYTSCLGRPSQCGRTVCGCMGGGIRIRRGMSQRRGPDPCIQWPLRPIVGPSRQARGAVSRRRRRAPQRPSVRSHPTPGRSPARSRRRRAWWRRHPGR